MQTATSTTDDSLRINDPQSSARQEWMRVLAKAGKALRHHEAMLRGQEHQFVRPAQTGMVMVRGRAGGRGAPFNLGEMTMTRCVVQLADGTMGHSYVAGRDKVHAELAALADACLQGPDSDYWRRQIIAPLRAMQDEARTRQAAETASTRVSFATLIRGEA